MQKARFQDQQEIATDQERRKLFLRYLNRGWLIFGLVTLASMPFFPEQRGQSIYLAVVIFPTYLLVRFLNLSGRTRSAGVVFALTVNFGFYGLFLFLVREQGAVVAFQTQATVWQLMGLAVLFAGALVDKWAAPAMALFDTVLLIGTQWALAPESDPRPSAVVFWWMMAGIIWLYESTLQQALARAWTEVAERKRASAERTRAEDEVRRLNEELEQRVSDRTRELAAANERLTELDRLKSKFVSDVSHELRTPIANLKLYIELLEMGKPEKHAEYMSVLQQQIRRVVALVDDILDLSRLERRVQHGSAFQVINLNELVEQVVIAHRPRAGGNGVELAFDPALDLPSIQGDAVQLAQAATNLVTNALRYTLAGYVRVSTFARGAEVCLCVSDSGRGIDPKDLPHIFDRFYRGRDVLKNEPPGSGLGLAIVKEIVDLHQGRIEVDSQPGQGATFRAWFPVLDA